MEKSIQTLWDIFAHALDCKGCNMQGCVLMKRSFQQAKANYGQQLQLGDVDVFEMVKERHALYCTNRRCPVPLCLEIQQQIREIEQIDDRDERRRVFAMAESASSDGKT
jgi:hypothetical protein